MAVPHILRLRRGVGKNDGLNEITNVGVEERAREGNVPRRVLLPAHLEVRRPLRTEAGIGSCCAEPRAVQLEDHWKSCAIGDAEMETSCGLVLPYNRRLPVHRVGATLR